MVHLGVHQVVHPVFQVVLLACQVSCLEVVPVCPKNLVACREFRRAFQAQAADSLMADLTVPLRGLGAVHLACQEVHLADQEVRLVGLAEHRACPAGRAYQAGLEVRLDLVVHRASKAVRERPGLVLFLLSQSLLKARLLPESPVLSVHQHQLLGSLVWQAVHQELPWLKHEPPASTSRGAKITLSVHPTQWHPGPGTWTAEMAA